MAIDDIQEVQTGDPEPKPVLAEQHRAKLDSIVQQMIKNKESDDNIRMVVNDFKQKYSAVEPTYPKPDQPTFQPMDTWLNLQPQQGYKPLDKANVVNDHTIKTQESSNRIKSHLADIDNSVHNLISDYKKNMAAAAQSEQLAINKPFEAAPLNPQAKELESKLRPTIEVLPNEVSDYKAGMNDNPVMFRQALEQKAKDLSKTNPIAANQLKSDIYRVDAQNRPEKEKKISENVEKINNGDLDYDVKKGILVKPEGFWGSLATSFKQKTQAFDDYDVFKSGNEKDILNLIKKRTGQDPDEPTPVPVGATAEAGSMLGGQPLKPLIGAGIAGYFGGPEAGAAAMSAISAPEMYKLSFGSSLPQNFDAIKKQHPDLSDSEVLQQAIDLSHKQANTDALTGAAMGAVGAKFGFESTGLGSGLLKKSVGSALKQIGEEGAKKTLEGVGVGAIGGAGQYVKNIMAQKAGIPTDEMKGVPEQLKAGIAMTAGITLVAKASNLIKPSTYNKLLHGLSKAPEEAVNSTINDLQQQGHITPDEAQKAQTDINKYKSTDISIPDHLSEPDRLEIHSKIDQRKYLEKQLETLDKSFHPEIKEQIKKIDEDIINISKGGEHGELQVLVAKSKIEGPAAEYLNNLDEKELKSAFKEIAAQAHDPNSANQAVITFGEDIVNKAKELYPKEEPQKSTVSVIQPGEIKQPEIITIASKEDGAGKLQPEQIGHVEVSEHGEDTKTAAKQENGTEPSKLSPDGVKEAEDLGQYLKEKGKTKIITSEVKRAQETANIAGKEAGIPVETNPLLNTWNIGKYDGKPEGSFVEEAWANKPNEAPEGGESFNDFTKRMEQAYQMVKSLPEDNHVISHSKVMRALEALKKTDGKWTDETTKYFLTNKELPNAVPIGISKALPLGEAPGNSPEMGQGIPESGETTNAQGGPAGEETSSNKGQEEIDKLPFSGGDMMGISHGSLRKLADVLGLKQPERGTFLTPEEQIKRGRELLKGGADPEQVAADFHKDGLISADNISVVRAHYEALLKDVRDAYEQHGVKSDEYITAKEKADKWQQEVIKPMGTASGAAMSSLQGETDIDTGSFVGLSRAFEERNGKEMSAQQAKEAKELSGKVAKLTKEVEDLKQKLTDAIDKGTNEGTKPEKSIKEQADKLADLIRKGKTNKPGSFQAATPASLVWDSALEIMAKTIETGGTVIQAISDGLSHIKESEWYKSLSDEKQRTVEEDFNKYFKNENDLFTRFTDKKDNKFSQEDVRDIWGYAKDEYLNKGKDFNEMVYGVSKDLGLTPDQVRHAITQPKGSKPITDELYKKQYNQRQAIQQAQAWVKSSSTPRIVKALKFIPHLFFRLKTFGHGTVGGITHAGMNVFRPTAWASYWPSFFKQFKFAFGKAADYEKAMQDLVNDPEFIKWKRGGLAIDPTEKYDDYQTFDRMLGRLGQAGDRGFNALKVMRLEMAKAEFDRLSAVEKSDPDVVKQIATIVNHATGTSKIPVPEAIGTAFFAPRLEASRWSRLITQPAKAIATFSNWKNASLAEKAAAKIVARRTGEVFATYLAALAANQGILMATGSKQQVNFTHPGDPDWLKFKIGGRTVDLSGGIISSIGFLSHLVKISVESEKDLRGKKRTDALFVAAMKYGRGKLSPFGSTVADITTQHDYGGNTMPFSSDKPGPFGHKLSWQEYIINQQTPIPVAEAIKDVTGQMEQRGMSKPEINQVMQGIFVGVMSGGTGVRIGEDFSVGKEGGSSGGAGATGTTHTIKQSISHTRKHR